MYNILITGSSGFIGKFLLKKLTSIDYIKIHVIARSSHSSFENHNNIVFHIGDIRDKDFCFNALKGIDMIINLAALINAAEIDLFETNVIGFYNLLFFGKINGIKSFLYFSSSSVYKNLFNQNENVGPSYNSFYSLTKNINELLSDFYHSEHLKIIGIRPFNVYGNDNLEFRDVVSTFFRNAIQNTTLYVPKAEVLRDFIYVDDVVNLIILIIKKIINENYLFPKIINFGTGISTSIQNLANEIIRVSKSKSQIKILENNFPDNFSLHSKSNNALVNKLFNYKFMTINDGLKIMYYNYGSLWKKNLRQK